MYFENATGRFGSDEALAYEQDDPLLHFQKIAPNNQEPEQEMRFFVVYIYLLHRKTFFLIGNTKFY